jgi:prepilin-type N-terminal cleavage/methylation domain-containing protein
MGHSKRSELVLKIHRQKGFTLLELLIVTAIIGLLASILLPNLLDALQKARQKRTMTDVRGIGTAWMSWMTDHHSAASAGATKNYDQSIFTPVTYTTLVTYLRPTDTFFYAQSVPRLDGWKHPMRFGIGPNQIKLFVCSPGRDGLFQQCNEDTIVVSPFLSTDYDQDIIWAEGYFLRYPDQLGADAQ